MKIKIIPFCLFVLQTLVMPLSCTGLEAYAQTATHPASAGKDDVYETVNLERRRILTIKTNLPAWGFLVSNVAVEASLSERFAVSLPVYFSALNYFHRNHKYRGFGIQPEVRFYTTHDRVYGLKSYVGAHFNLLFFNYAGGGLFRFQDEGRRTPVLGGGLHAGLLVPFRHGMKLMPWGLELQVGLGWNRLHIDKFVNMDNGLRIDRFADTYFGIDNIGVSLYYNFRTK